MHRFVVCHILSIIYLVLSLNNALFCTALGHLFFFTCKLFTKVLTSVADPGYLSRILIFTHSGSRISDPGSRIPDPKTATKERGEKKISCQTFFVATNFTKLKIILFFNAEEKNLGQFSKNYRTFYPKICH
jgi:hypothetical protein